MIKYTPDPPPWAFVLIIGFFFLILLLGSCISKRKNTINNVYRSRGYCWYWDKIESEIIGHKLCNTPLSSKSGVICTRKKGHKGLHHNHGAEDCYWIWETTK